MQHEFILEVTFVWLAPFCYNLYFAGFKFSDWLFNLDQQIIRMLKTNEGSINLHLSLNLKDRSCFCLCLSFRKTTLKCKLLDSRLIIFKMKLSSTQNFTKLLNYLDQWSCACDTVSRSTVRTKFILDRDLIGVEVNKFASTVWLWVLAIR